MSKQARSFGLLQRHAAGPFRIERGAIVPLSLARSDAYPIPRNLVGRGSAVRVTGEAGSALRVRCQVGLRALPG